MYMLCSDGDKSGSDSDEESGSLRRESGARRMSLLEIRKRTSMSMKEKRASIAFARKRLMSMSLGNPQIC